METTLSQPVQAVYDAMRERLKSKVKEDVELARLINAMSDTQLAEFKSEAFKKYAELPEYQVVLEDSHEEKVPAKVVNTTYMPVYQPAQTISVPARTRKLRSLDTEMLYQSYKDSFDDQSSDERDEGIAKRFTSLTPEKQEELYSIAKDEKNENLKNFFYQHKPKNLTEKFVDEINGTFEDLKNTPNALAQGGEEYLQNMQLFGCSLTGDRKKMDEIIKNQPDWNVGENKSYIGGAFKSTAQMLPSLAGGMAFKTIPTAIASGLSIETGPGAVAIGAGTYATASALHGYAMGWGEIYKACRQANLSHEESETSANYLAPINSGLETVQLASILKPLGINKILGQKLAPELLKKLSEKGVLKRLGGATLDIVKESAEEGGQGATVEFAVQRAEKADGKRTEYDATKIASAAGKDFVSSLAPMAILKGTTSLAGRISRAGRSDDEIQLENALDYLDKTNPDIDNLIELAQTRNVDADTPDNDKLDLQKTTKGDVIAFVKDKTEIFNTPKYSNPNTPEFVITPRNTFESTKDFTDFLIESDEVAPKIRERLKYAENSEEIWESDYLPLFAQKYEAKVNGFNATVKPQTEYQLARNAQSIIDAIPDEEQSLKLEAISATDIRYLSNDHLEYAIEHGEKWAETELQKRIEMESINDAFEAGDGTVFNQLDLEGIRLPKPSTVKKRGGSYEELDNIYSKLPNHLKAKYFAEGGRPLDETAQLLGYEDENTMLSAMDSQVSEMLARIEKNNKYSAEEAPIIPEGLPKKKTQKKETVVPPTAVEQQEPVDEEFIEFNVQNPQEHKNTSFKVFNAPNNAVEIRKQKKKIAQNGWKQEDVENLVNSFYKKEDFNHLFGNLNNTIFLSVPSTQGLNTIPFEFAKRLADDFNGNAIFGNNIFKNEANIEAKNKRSLIAKLENPTDFKVKNPNQLDLLKNKNIVVVVDDTFTSGETILEFDRFLRQNGITPILSVSLAKLGDKADIANEKYLKALAKKISSLTNISEDKIKADVDLVLKGLGESFLIRAINESGANKSNAQRIANLLAKRAREIRRAQSSRIRNDKEGWETSGQLGFENLQNPRGKIGVSGIQGHRVFSGVGRSDGDISKDINHANPILAGIGKLDKTERFDPDKLDNATPKKAEDAQKAFDVLKKILGDANEAEVITNKNAQEIYNQIKIWGEKLDPRMLDLPELVELANEFLTDPTKASSRMSPGVLGFFKYRRPSTIFDFFHGSNGLYNTIEKKSKATSTIEIRKDLFALVNGTEKYRLCQEAVNEVLKMVDSDGTNLENMSFDEKLEYIQTKNIGEEEVNAVEIFKQIYEEKLASLKEYKKNNGGTAIDATVVLAHEIGHLVDYLPQGVIKGRGNILARIASLREYTKSTLSTFTASAQIDDAKRRQFRRQAERSAADLMGIPKLIYYKNLKKYSQPIQDKYKKLVAEHYEQIVNDYCEKNHIVKEEDIRQELTNVIKYWQNVNNVSDYFLSPEEMFAESFSCFLCNPKKFAELAPKTHRVLMARMMAKKDVWEKWTELQMRISDPKVRIQKISERVSEMFSSAHFGFANTRESIEQARKRLTKERILAATWSQWQPIYNEAEKIAKAKGISREEVTESIDKNRYSMSAVEAYVQLMNRDIYKPLIANANTIDQLGKYLFCQRIYHEREDIANPLGITPAVAKQLRDDILNSMSDPQRVEFLRIVKKLQQLRYKYVIKPIVDAKVFSDELTEKLSKNIYYTTFNVVKEDNSNKTIDLLLESIFKGGGAGIFKQTGTLAKIENPIEATLAKDVQLIMFVHRNKAIKEYTNILQSTIPDFIEKAKTEFDHKTKAQKPVIHHSNYVRTLTYYQNGRLHAYYVPSVYGDVFFEKNADELQQIFRWIAKLPKAFYTQYNPAFWTKGAIRDIRTMLERLPRPKGSSVLVGRAKVLKAITTEYVKTLFGKADRDITNVLQRGMAVARTEYMGETASATEIQKNLKKFGLNPNKFYGNQKTRWEQIKSFFGGLWLAYSNGSQCFERSAKIASMKYLDKYHPSMSEAEKAQIVRELGGSPDFRNKQVRGYGLLFDYAFMFFNPRIRGIESTYKRLKKDPVDTLFGMIAYGLPSLALRWALRFGGLHLLYEWLKDIFSEEQIKDMQTAWDRTSEVERRTYDILPLGKFMDENGKEDYWCIRIPLEDTSKYLLASFDAIMRGLDEKSYKETISAFGELIQDELCSLNPILRISANSAQSVWQIAQPNALSTPPESRYGPIMDSATWKSGRTLPIANETARYIWNETFGSVVWRLNSNPADRSTFENAINIPFIKSFIGNFLYVPRGGVNESLRKIDNQTALDQAGRTLDKRQLVENMLSGNNIKKDEIKLLEEIASDNRELGVFINKLGNEGTKKENKLLGIVLSGNDSKENKIKKLNILKDKGEITEERYRQALIQLFNK